jgi:Skp family chaperone for outer membrane proteins
MQQSIEGKEITEKVKKEISEFQKEVELAQKELGDMQEALNKQAKVISKDASQEKAEELALKRKDMETKFAHKEESLRNRLQKYQMTLREKQLAVINEVFEKEKWTAVIDKNTPGLLCVANTIDRTDKVLRAVDEKYMSSKKSTKVAKATPKATASKPEIKVA